MSKTVAVNPTQWSAAKLKEIWSTFDFNGSGYLSLAEIDRAVLETFPQMFKHKPAILRAYKAADVSKDGYIQFKEFANLLNLLGFYDDLWKKFQSLDKNGDRRLTFAEFREGNKMLGIPGSDVEIKRIFDELDANKGGFLLFDEFCLYFAKKLSSSV